MSLALLFLSVMHIWCLPTNLPQDLKIFLTIPTCILIPTPPKVFFPIYVKALQQGITWKGFMLLLQVSHHMVDVNVCSQGLRACWHSLWLLGHTATKLPILLLPFHMCQILKNVQQMQWEKLWIVPQSMPGKEHCDGCTPNRPHGILCHLACAEQEQVAGREGGRLSWLCSLARSEAV